MASSVIVDCSADVWTKVATGIVEGRIEPVDAPGALRYYASPTTGGPAPTVVGDGIFMTNTVVKNDPSAVDLYCYSVGAASKIRTVTVI